LHNLKYCQEIKISITFQLACFGELIKTLRLSKFGGRMRFSRNKRKYRKMTSQVFWLVVFIAYFCIFNSEAQSKKSDKVIFDNCETGISKLGFVINDFVETAKPDSYLVIIGGAMKNEKLSYNSWRIQQSIKYLSFGERKINKVRIVFGTGLPETKSGYLRFYVNGILSAEIITYKNAKLCFGEGDEIK
jgi:hypothetical protein